MIKKNTSAFGLTTLGKDICSVGATMLLTLIVLILVISGASGSILGAIAGWIATGIFVMVPTFLPSST